MALIDRVKVRRLVEQRLATVVGMRWDFAGHAVESEGGVVEGTVLDLRLERQVLNPDDAAFADISFTVQVTVDREHTDQSLYTIDEMVQKIVTLWHTPTQGGGGAVEVNAHRFIDSVEFGAEEAEGLIVGLVTVIGQVKSATSSGVEDVGEQDV